MIPSVLPKAISRAPERRDPDRQGDPFFSDPSGWAYARGQHRRLSCDSPRLCALPGAVTE
eukprot:3412103-Rhodomonas_salina.2